jgi:EpsI family protein
MKQLKMRYLIVGFVMLAAAGLAPAMKPTQKYSDLVGVVNLEAMIPKQFGDWKVDSSMVPLQVSPDVQAMLDKIYAQLVSRTYVNSAGDRVMLSIAYGTDQGGEATQVHRPEFCYTAQGFQLLRNAVDEMVTRYGSLAVTRLIAVSGPRNEPITYWITIGDTAALPGFRRKLTQLRYGLTGTVPDGMLVRVSSIDRDEAHAYRIQDQFVNALLTTMSDKDRTRLVGAFKAKPG